MGIFEQRSRYLRDQATEVAEFLCFPLPGCVDWGRGAIAQIISQLLDRLVGTYSWLLFAAVQPGFPPKQVGSGEQSGCLPLLLCVPTYVWFGFRFLADTKLPFLSLVELAEFLWQARTPGE